MQSQSHNELEATRYTSFEEYKAIFFNFNAIFCKYVYEMSFIRGFQEIIWLWKTRQAFYFCTSVSLMGLSLMIQTTQVKMKKHKAIPIKESKNCNF